MTPEQHFILSLLSPMKTFPMVIPAHIRERIAKLIRVERKDGNPSSLSIIAREAMTLYAIEQKRNPFPVDIPPMDKQGKSANIKVPPSIADSMESLATREAQTAQGVITKSDVARAAIVWFLDQMEAEQC